MSEEDVGLVVTPVFTAAWPNLFKARAFEKNGRPQGSEKYDIVLICETHECGEMKAVASRVAAAQWPGGVPANLLSPFRDGTKFAQDKNQKRIAQGQKERDFSCFHGKTVIVARSQFPPQVVGVDRQPILDEKQIYSGVRAVAQIRFRAYMSDLGTSGLTTYINMVMKVGDAEKILVSAVNPADVFAGIQGVTSDEDPTQGMASVQMPW